LHFIGCIILHHFADVYNPFFIFSVTDKKTSGKGPKWVIFPEVVKYVLTGCGFHQHPANDQ